MLDRLARFSVIALELLLTVTTVFGAIWVVPLLPTEWLSGTPFKDYKIPSLALGMIGIGALAGAALLVFRPIWGALLTICVGAAMAIFEVVETLVVGADVWLYALHLGPKPDPSGPSFTGASDVAVLLGIPIPLWLQPFYFGYGLTLVAIGLRLFVHAVNPAFARTSGIGIPETDRRSSTPRPLPITRGLAVVFVLSGLVAGLLVVTSIAGLAFGTRGLYRPDAATLPTFMGQDLITLCIVLPLLLLTIWRVHRGSLRALLLLPGLLVYIAYSYAYYLISPEFNPLYLAYISVVSMSGYALLFLLLSIDVDILQTRFTSTRPVRWAGGFLIVMAVLMGSMWISAILAALARGVQPPAKELGVWPMDLVIAFPAMFWGGIWLVRSQPLGYLVGALLLVKAASVGLTLVVTSWLVTWWGEPLDPMLPAYAVVGLGGVLLSGLYLRNVTGDRTESASQVAARRPADVLAATGS